MRETKRDETPRQAIARAEAAVKAGMWEEALAEFAAAVRIGEIQPGHGASADAWRGAAMVHMRLGRWKEAARDAAESRRLASEVQDERRLALAENLLGAIAFEGGNWYEAGLRYGVAREYAGTIEDEPLLVEIENNDGVLWAALGDRRRAEESFRWALARFEELERNPCGAKVLNNLGMVLVAEGRLEEADALYERALAESKRRLDLGLGATVMVNRARLALLKNDVIRAHTLTETANIFCERLGGGPLVADIACVAGAVARTLKNWSEAEATLGQARALSGGGKAPQTEAEVWMEFGELYAAQDRNEEALTAWSRARDCYRALGAVVEAQRAEAKIAATAGAPGLEAAQA
jgi:tetratricopeptide (TPR) repeat protein